MGVAAIFSFLLIVSCAMIHYAALHLIYDSLPNIRFIPRTAKVPVAVLGAIISHAVQIVLFGASFYILRDHFGLGSFGGEFRDAFTSFLYFSAETYTSLGFGDIFPLGQLRMLTGVEALTGLLMISWTASFTYLEMSRFWKQHES